MPEAPSLEAWHSAAWINSQNKHTTGVQGLYTGKIFKRLFGKNLINGTKWVFPLSGLLGLILIFPASFSFYPRGLSRLGPACPPAAGWQGVESRDCGTGGYLQLQCSRNCEQQQGIQPNWFSHANCWLLVNTLTEESAYFCPSSFPAVPSPAEGMKACICRGTGHCTATPWGAFWHSAQA